MADLNQYDFADECVRRSERYTQAVLDGEIVTGQLERLAVQRHVDMLQQSDEDPDYPYYWDPDGPYRVYRFISFCRHFKDPRFAGKQLLLSGWQAFCDAVVYGWRRHDNGLRLIKTALYYVGRKNGKTTWFSAKSNYHLCYDGQAGFESEPGAECYAVATKRDQAKILFNASVTMARKSPELASVLRVNGGANPYSMTHDDSVSKFEPLGKDSNTQDGQNPSFVVMDEIHAMKTRDMWDVMASGESREQFLKAAITTAGFSREGIAREQRDYAEQVLRGAVQDDELFAFICELDPGDDWRDETVYRKANPNLGISVNLEILTKARDRAIAVPAQQAGFRCKRLNEWVNRSGRAIELGAWLEADKGAYDNTGRRCYAGLDLSETEDICAVVYAFPPDEERELWEFDADLFCPQASIDAHQGDKVVPYDVWARQGYLSVIPGNVIDHDHILDSIVARSEQHDIREIGYDPWNAVSLISKLENEGLTTVKMRQGFQTLSAPTKELFRLLKAGKLNTGVNPAMRWMAENLAVHTDDHNNQRPTKNRREEKIDGMVALIMGIGRAMAADEGAGSVYDSQMPLVFGN